MSIKRIFCAVIAGVLSAFMCGGAASGTECTERIGMVLAEAETGTVLYEDDSRVKLPCGSLCKLMTILLAEEAVEDDMLRMDELLTVSERANSMQGAQIWLMPGEKITLSDLLTAVIIGNANDAAVVIAEAAAGSEEVFTDMMNSRAESLGMNDTFYVNSSGYEADGSYTTAYDTARLMSELAKHDICTEMFTTRLTYLRGGEVQLVNSNPAAVKLKGSKGFKAGFTGSGKRQRFYAAEAAERNGDTYIAAVIGAPDEDNASAKAVELLEYGFSEYETVIPDTPEDMPVRTDVRNGLCGSVRLRTSGIRKMVIPRGTADMITSRIACPGYIYAPVKKDSSVGKVIYYYNGNYAYSADICPVRNIERKSIGSAMCDMLRNIFEV